MRSLNSTKPLIRFRKRREEKDDIIYIKKSQLSFVLRKIQSTRWDLYNDRGIKIVRQIERKIFLLLYPTMQLNNLNTVTILSSFSKLLTNSPTKQFLFVRSPMGQKFIYSVFRSLYCRKKRTRRYNNCNERYKEKIKRQELQEFSKNDEGNIWWSNLLLTLIYVLNWTVKAISNSKKYKLKVVACTINT